MGLEDRNYQAFVGLFPFLSMRTMFTEDLVDFTAKAS